MQKQNYIIEFPSRDSLINSLKKSLSGIGFSQSSLKNKPVQLDSEYKADIFAVTANVFDRHFIKTLVIEDNEYADHLSLISVALINYFPLTSHFRILKKSDFLNLIRPNQISSYDYAKLLASISIAEYFLVSPTRIFNDTNYTHYKSTFGYLAAVSLLQGKANFELIWSRWSEIREHRKYSLFSLRSGELFDFWNSMKLGEDNKKRSFQKELVEIISSSGDIEKLILEYFANKKRSSIDVEALFKSDKIKKSRLFNELTTRNHDEKDIDMIMGLCITKMSNFAFLNPNIPFETRENYPLSLLWSGVFSAHYDQELDSGLGDFLNRIVSSYSADLKFDFEPNCDIAYDEYMLYGSENNFPKKLIKSQSNGLKIEILPNINCYNFISKSDVRTDREQRAMVGKFTRSKLGQIRKALNEIEAVVELGSKQGELFD